MGHPLTRRLAHVVAGTALVVVSLCAAPGPASASAPEGHFPAPPRADPRGGAIALIGVPALQWSDLSPRATPHLWRLAESSALGSLSVRTVGTVSCPYDSWLTLSAGVRTASGGRCGAPPAPEPRGEGAVVPGFTSTFQGSGQKAAGALGQALKTAGQCATAIGPGAAVALADPAGEVGVYAASPAEVRPEAMSRCRVTVADVDDLMRPYLASGAMPREPEPLSAAERLSALHAADARVGEVLALLPADATVLVAGLSDHDSVPHLRVAAMKASDTRGRTLGARSTHRDDMVILPDISVTLLTAVEAEVPAHSVGAAWEAGERRLASVEQARDELMAAETAGQSIRRLGGGFYWTLAGSQLLFYAAALLLLRRRGGLRGVRVTAVVLASLPVSTYLVNLVPWHRSEAPVAVLAGGIAGCGLLIASAALLGPWGRRPLGPLAVVTGVTAATLLGDLLTGTTLQFNSVMGFNGINGARYHGLGNIPFALLATSVLLGSVVVAHRLSAGGRRTLGAAVVAVAGGAAMALGGMPGIGSDFGGVIAFLPGIAVTALLISGRKVSVVKLGAFCVAGAVAVMSIAFLDHMRPTASQSHLGRFAGQLLAGEALPVVMRKFDAMIRTLVNPNLMPIVLAALAFLVFAVLRPGAASAGVLPAAFAHSPALRAGLIGTLVSGGVGTLVNDSGAAVLSMALALAVPLVLSVGIAALRPAASPAAPGTPPRPAGAGGSAASPTSHGRL
ncbi:hypothetical protein SAMN05421505_13918 [Sinosporangium album]|uniref:Uncharacterized protein n=1 Tax=Sinosporangium album TaxID=504805 RepID=A0A1G8IU90_9ACTN|nr:hypothetical protein [Sinosporangium album]SDI22509.1 hypothetical protein SAMN05421505_13918 [Sinosporangium album]